MLTYAAESSTPWAGFSVETIAILVALALAPFLLAMMTCFTKLIIVGGLLRQALGTQQIPPNSVITGLALLLSAHIMTPVAREAWSASTDALSQATRPEERIAAVVEHGGGVIGGFLRSHASLENTTFFSELPAAQPDPSDGPAVARATRLITVEAPAFLLTELQEAMEIGFLLLLPFFVIDLVVGNVLMALGMMMTSPQVIALPLKIVFFVSVDGWRLVFQGLIDNYSNLPM